MKQIRVIGFAPAGSGANFFASWQNVFATAGMLLAPFELPGRGRRVAERPLDNWSDVEAEATKAIKTDPRSTTVLWGHSFGALVAYRAATALHGLDESPATALIVAGRRPPDGQGLDLPANSDDKSLLDFVQKLGGLHPALRADASFVKSFLPALRADLELDALGGRGDETVLNIPVVGLAGDNDPVAAPSVMAGWSRTTEAPFRLVCMSGDHFFMRHHMEVVVRLVAGVASNC